MHLNDLFETSNRDVLVIYPGRFQPFHQGHRSVYDHLVGEYGFDNVYISTSDKTEPEKSPFNFSEKLRMMNLTGINSGRVIKSVQPYQSLELVNKIDKKNTILLFAVSQKDMADDPRFKFKPKKDGSPSYFQKAPKNLDKCESADKHAYITTVPTQDFTVLGKPVNSASQIRTLFAASDEATKKEIVKDLFGKFNASVYKTMLAKVS